MRWQKDVSGGGKMRAVAERCEQWRKDVSSGGVVREMAVWCGR